MPFILNPSHRCGKNVKSFIWKNIKSLISFEDTFQSNYIINIMGNPWLRWLCSYNLKCYQHNTISIYTILWYDHGLISAFPITNILTVFIPEINYKPDISYISLATGYFLCSYGSEISSATSSYCNWSG